MNLVDEIGPGITSLEYVRAQLRMDRPVSVRNLLARYREPIVLDEPLITSDGVALGGHHTITLQRHGHFRHEGHMRATGFPSFRYGVRTVMAGPSGTPAYVAAASGEVHGTNEFGDRESSWDDSGEQVGIKQYWVALKSGGHTTDISFQSDFFGTFGDVAAFVATLAGGFFVAGSVGVCFVLGVHAADAAGLDEAFGTSGLAGVAVAGGVLVVFGPGAIIPAIVAGVTAGVAVELALKHRRLTDRPHEVEFANRVFRGSLPVNRIVLTNMLGMGRRPFTIPSVGDTILVNLGAGFDQPTQYPGLGDPENPATQAPGQLFIHELVHAWQIDTASFMPGLICGALLNQATTIGGNMSVYRYGPPDRDFGRFNLEQQASIIDDWFGRYRPGATPSGEGEADPYFRYVRDNIRKRIL
ncbi:MAG: hypothetical protein ABJA98_28510 [Acidobacteriota bacterium]